VSICEVEMMRWFRTFCSPRKTRIPHAAPLTMIGEGATFPLMRSKLGFLLVHGLAAADEYMLLSTTARLIHNNPVTADPAFKRRFLLCWSLAFCDLLGLGDFFLSLSRHLLSPLLNGNGVYESLLTIRQILIMLPC